MLVEFVGKRFSFRVHQDPGRAEVDARKGNVLVDHDPNDFQDFLVAGFGGDP